MTPKELIQQLEADGLEAFDELRASTPGIFDLTNWNDDILRQFWLTAWAQGAQAMFTTLRGLTGGGK